MNCAEDYVRYLCQYLLNHCLDDLSFLSRLYDRNCIKRIEGVAKEKFARVTYTEAIEILKDAQEGKGAKSGGKKKKFENKVEWGVDLASEHERSVLIIRYEVISGEN